LMEPTTSTLTRFGRRLETDDPSSSAMALVCDCGAADRIQLPDPGV